MTAYCVDCGGPVEESHSCAVHLGEDGRRVYAGRRRMPEERRSVIRKLKIGPLKVYAVVGLFPDGRPGELFLHGDRLGTFEHGLLDALALMTSLAWQAGVPLEVTCGKLRGWTFEPRGMTGDPEFPFVSSIADYLARWLLARFGASEPGGDA